MTHATRSAAPGIWCGEFDLFNNDGLRGPRHAGAGHHRTRVLVRAHGRPLGYLHFDAAPDAVSSREIRVRSVDSFGDSVNADAPEPIADAPFVSVIVCTRDHTELLTTCLDRIQALDYPDFEVLVVDNAPSTEETRELLAAICALDSRFRYLRQERPGLSAARNAGIAAARGEILAYTDDDVLVDRNWLTEIARTFRDEPAIGCVTGLVATAAIETNAEGYFDARSPSWSGRMTSERYDLSGRNDGSPLYPYSAGIFGTGANLALAREAVDRVGEFDEALGAGAKTKGGEDLDIFVRVLRAGFAIAYEPAALVWHQHRADDDALRGQLYGYGTGLTAFLTKYLANPATSLDIVSRLFAGVKRLASIRTATEGRMLDHVEAPAGAWQEEVRGYLAGPVLYARARLASRTRQAGLRRS
ncbi:glycosyltransferase [Pseudoclavibacter terrae]|uniref:glycosyltransferase n=1 Tax=Pseudoclavibacter terrae TaxID=1530195 RepID=UPI00232EF6AC|nr:glycosyltransferase [Pseudoclavibacter terrae]